jgi:hypothetical protein
MNAEGFDENVAPATFGILSKAENAPDGSFVTGLNLESLRKTFGKAAQSTNPTERAAAGQAQRGIDEFLQNIPAQDVRSGDPRAFSQTVAEANANYSAGKTAERLDKRIAKAELQADSTNSGMNLANKLRQQAAQILTSDTAKRGLRPEELGMVEQIARGTATQNTLRWFGNLLGGGGGLGAVVTGIPTAGIAPAIGFGLRSLSNALTMRQIGKISEVIRARSPLGQKSAAALADWQSKFDELKSAPSYARFTALGAASRNLSNELASAGVQISPRELLRAVQGPSGATAEDEQQ